MGYVFSESPQRVYWELTRACDLSCKHCRADAQVRRSNAELSTEDVFATLAALAEGPKPHVILTGGDPLKRPDFLSIVDRTVALGLPCLVAPSATPLLDAEAIAALASAGVTAMSLSLDGSDALKHDGLRGVPGTFNRTLDAARAIVATPISLQINTLVTSETRGDLPAIYQLVRSIGAQRWSLFFLIAAGRGRTLQQITPFESEAVMNWALDLTDERTIVTTTEAPHVRRLAVMRHAARIEHRPSQTADRRGLGIRDGNGVMFISHTGDVQPSGFLPVTAGNVRATHPLEIYRSSDVFQQLRKPDHFEGRCGRCEFREICGGSRARAYATTGNMMAEDPLCPYEPSRAN